MNRAQLPRVATGVCVALLFGATPTGVALDPRPATADDNWDPRFALSGLNTLGGAPSGARAVAYLGGNLYVGGTFDSAGRTLAHSIARWDGAHWSALGDGILSGEVAGSAIGLSGTANALATVGTNLYAGGSFKVAGDQYASGIARWDGVAWHSLGGGIVNGVQDKNGLPAEVYALAAAGGDLYVGGNFAKAGGIAAPGMARWNGQAWLPVGAGIHAVPGTSDPGRVTALAVDGVNLYAGGNFGMAGTANAANIARWNGSEWTQLGGGLVVSDSSTYQRFGVSSIAVAGNKVAMTGFFYSASAADHSSEIDALGFALWDGKNWSAAPSTTDGGAFFQALFPDHATVGDLGPGRVIAVGGQFYLTGAFAYPDDTRRWGLARLAQDGRWEILADGIGTNQPDDRRVARGELLPLLSLATDGTRIAIGGGFSRINNVGASGIAEWDGQHLASLDDGGGAGLYGLWSGCDALAIGDTNLFAAISNSGGAQAGGVVVNGLARWDGQQWSALGAGVRVRDDTSGILGSGQVTAFAHASGRLYVGGNFGIAGEDYANNVASWDGNQWTALGTGAHNGIEYPGAHGFTANGSPVHAITVNGPDIFVAGEFSLAGGIPANSIARWDGIKWSTLGGGLAPIGNRQAAALGMAMGSDGLYVGGVFEQAGGVDSRNIARWDGAAWHSVGGGVGDFQVNAVEAHNGQIYIAGMFTSVGSVPADGVARWNGTEWIGYPARAAVPGGPPAYLTTGRHLAFDGDDLYVAGQFTPTDGTPGPIQGIARWTAGGWVLLGVGIRSALLGPEFGGMVIVGKSLYVGGHFDTAGNRLSAGIGRYNLANDFTRPYIDSVAIRAGGVLRCTAINVFGDTAVLEASGDFSGWLRLATNSVAGQGVTFDDPLSASSSHRFYRVVVP